MPNQKSFVLALCAALSVLLIVSFCLYKTNMFITVGVFQVLGFLIPAFAVLTFLLYKNILRSHAKSPKRFVAAFIGAVSIKLFACAIFLGVYMYNNGEGRVIIAIATMLIYLVFNVLLIRFLMAAVRNK